MFSSIASTSCWVMAPTWSVSAFKISEQLLIMTSGAPLVNNLNLAPPIAIGIGTTQLITFRSEVKTNC